MFHITGVGLKPNGEMETPPFDQNLAGWYTKGPRPGETGPAVIAAHVDSKTGPDVFYQLHKLERGDRVTIVDARATKHTFTVRRKAQHDKDKLPVSRIWGEVNKPVLRPITCGGTFNESTGHYRDNIIVYAN